MAGGLWGGGTFSLWNISAVDLSGTRRTLDGFQQAPESSRDIEMWPNPIGQGKGHRSTADPQRENVQTPTVVPHLTGFGEGLKDVSSSQESKRHDESHNN